MRRIEQRALFGLSDTVSRVRAQVSRNPPSSPGVPEGATQEVVDANAAFALVSAGSRWTGPC